MIVVIAGSRGITDPALVEQAMRESGFWPTRVRSGGARGVDELGEAWAHARGIPVTVFRADWERHGRSAGYKRNAEMVRNAGAVVAIWDGKSKGTQHTIRLAESAGIPSYILRTDMSLMAPPPERKPGGGLIAPPPYRRDAEPEYAGPPIPEGVPLVGFCCHNPICGERHGWVLRSKENLNPCALCGVSCIVTYPCQLSLEVAKI